MKLAVEEMSGPKALSSLEAEVSPLRRRKPDDDPAFAFLQPRAIIGDESMQSSSEEL